MSKHELLKEIDYLTKLIESHEAKKRRVTYESVSGFRIPAAKQRHNWTAAGQHRSPNLKHKLRGKNLVYKPNAIPNPVSVPPCYEQSASTLSPASPASEKIAPLCYGGLMATPTCNGTELTPRTHQLVTKKRQSSCSSKKPFKKLKRPGGGQYVWLAKDAAAAHTYKHPREPPQVNSTSKSQYTWECRAAVGPRQHTAAPPASSAVGASNQRGPVAVSSINHTHKMVVPTSDKLGSVRTPGRFHLKKRNRVWRANGDNSPGIPRPVAGSETLSKCGNKVWVSATLPKGRLVGSSGGWKRRNKVWVSTSVGPSTSNQKKATDRQPYLRRQDFLMDKGGKRMRRLTSTSCAPPTPLIKRALASRVVKKSLAHVWHARRQTHLNPNSSASSSSKQYCIFYNRFGKCTRGDRCPYIHDPERVAVCTKFLRGVCSKTDGTCPFYHKATKEKVPVCSFFLRGICARDECPYLHVSVGKNAEVCSDFVKGYCPRGEQCDKKHIVDCPEFSRSGTCPQRGKCPLRHRQRTNNRPLSLLEKVTVSPVKEPYAFKKVRQKLELKQSFHASSKGGVASCGSAIITPKELEFIPLEAPLGKERGPAPDFIAL